jgi:hypothetical protein
MKRLRPEIGAVCLIALFSIIAYWKVIFLRGYTFFIGVDLAGQYYPWYQFAGWACKHGFLPLWNPFNGGGELFFKEMQPGGLYPMNLILFLLPSHTGGVSLRSMDLFILPTVIVAGLGEYFLLRFLKLSRASSIIGATIIALSGYAAFVVGHQSIFEGIAWLPWVVLVFLKALESEGTKRIRYVLGCGLLLGIVILAGHLQPPAHTCLILLFLAAAAMCRKNAPRPRIAPAAVLFGTIAFSLAVAAIQLLPTTIYSFSAYRWVGGVRLDPGQRVPFELQELFSPAQYISLLVPATTSHQFYFGILALFLALFGALAGNHRYRRLFALGAILSFLYSWGRASSLFSALYLFIPFLEKVPESSRALFMLQFFVAGLAAMGADVLIHPLPARLRRKFEIIANAVLIFSGIMLVIALVAAFWVVQRYGLIGTDSFVSYGFSAGLLAIGSGLIFLRKYRMIRLKSLGAALVLLMAFDLTSRLQANTPPRSLPIAANNVYAETSTTAFLRELPGLFRVADLDKSFPINFGDAFRIQTISEYGASLSKAYHDFLFSGPGFENAMRMMNVRYRVSRKGAGELRCIHRDDQTGVSVYEDPQALPRVAFVAADRIPDSSKAGEYLLETRRFDGESRILSYEPNEITAICKSSAAGYLWFSELYYPGWKAYVDGREAPVLVSDKVFRMVPVSPGEHTVRLIFRPIPVFAGALISFIAILLAVISSIGLFRQKRPGQPAIGAGEFRR